MNLRITIRQQDSLTPITNLAEEDYEEMESFFIDAHQILDDLERMRVKQRDTTDINIGVHRSEEES